VEHNSRFKNLPACLMKIDKHVYFSLLITNYSLKMWSPWYGAMTHSKNVRYTIIAGLLLFLFGIALIVCTFPVFSHTRQEVLLVPMSEVILNSTFNIDEFQNKTVTFQLSIGENITILATSNGNISCSIANFDKPDDVYFFQNDTTTINKTWSPAERVSEVGKYYLIFLAHDAPQTSPVQVHANATKTWTDIQLIEVPAEDRISLLDQNFIYAGSASVIIGTVLFSITFSRSSRPRSQANKKF
jgi:hypothetical protein